MGTNYYLKKNICPHCGKAEESLHIGKSSAGWCFGLRSHPDHGINDLPDWEPLFRHPTNRIEDECGGTVSADEMLDTIKNRSRPDRNWESPPPAMFHAATWDEFLDRNYAAKGPNGLFRHVFKNARSGSGTWDICDYEFS